MIRTIKASVGIANGRQCYNLVEDQLTVIQLLNSISATDGGRRGNPLPDKSLALRQGTVLPDLYTQILQFQRRHGLSVDGHIDPGLGAMRRLNDLANADSRPGITIVVQNASAQLPRYVDTTIRALTELTLPSGVGRSSLSDLAADAIRRFFRFDPAAAEAKANIQTILGKYRTLRQNLNALRGDLNVNDAAKDLISQQAGGEKATAAYAVMGDEPDEKAGIYINPSSFQPLNELRRTGIILHEMCHFYLQMPEDRNPQKFSPIQNITGTVQSYDWTAFQINFGQIFMEDFK